MFRRPPEQAAPQVETTRVPLPLVTSMPSDAPAATRRRGPLIAAALLAVAVVAALAVFGLMQRGPDPDPDPTPNATPAQRALLAALPVGYGSTSCTPAPERENADIDAAVACPGGPAGGPSSAVFLHYRTPAGLEAAQQVTMTTRGLTAVPSDTGQCRAGTPVATTWTRGSSSGRLTCYADAASGAVLEWTEPRALARGILTRSDGDAAALYDWWAAVGFL